MDARDPLACAMYLNETKEVMHGVVLAVELRYDDAIPLSVRRPI
jgi:hypothetical protein